MTYASKQRLAGILLVVLGLWPLAHFFVVRALDLNPWNWFGWAMYTTPPRRLSANVMGPDGRRLDARTIPPEARQRVQAAFKEYSDLYLELGAVVTTDEFARVCLEAYPAFDHVTIEVFAVRVDRETATVVKSEIEDSPFVHRRGDL